MNRIMLVCSTFFGLALGLSAAPFTISTGGTFSSTTPTTAWTAPGDSWALSFIVDSTPSVISSSAGDYTEVPLTNFSYTLNGASVSVGTVDLVFYSSGSLGLFNICFFGCSATSSPTNGFVIEGGQAYSGSESAPTILTGSYAESIIGVFTSGTATDLPTGTVLISAAPEPSTFLSLALGGSLLFVKRRRALTSRPSSLQ